MFHELKFWIRILKFHRWTCWFHPVVVTCTCGGTSCALPVTRAPWIGSAELPSPSFDLAVSILQVWHTETARHTSFTLISSRLDPVFSHSSAKSAWWKKLWLPLMLCSIHEIALVKSKYPQPSEEAVYVCDPHHNVHQRHYNTIVLYLTIQLIIFQHIYNGVKDRLRT